MTARPTHWKGQVPRVGLIEVQGVSFRLPVKYAWDLREPRVGSRDLRMAGQSRRGLLIAAARCKERPSAADRMVRPRGVV